MISELKERMLSMRKGEPMEQQNEVTPESLLLTIPQVCKLLGLGRNTIYNLIYTEGLPVQKFGRARRISRVALQHWLEQRERQNP